MLSFIKYNPVYSVFLIWMNQITTKLDSIIKYQMIDLETVKKYEYDSIEKKDIFIKFSPLLDPITIYDW